MRHAKTFVKVPSSARLAAAPAPQVRGQTSTRSVQGESAVRAEAQPPPPPVLVELPSPPPPIEVRSQTSEVSNGPPLTSDLRPLTSDLVRRRTPVDGREFDRLLGEMGWQSRRRILWMLAEDGRANVTTLCRRLGISQKRISSHLNLLKLCSLVFDERQGQRVWYEINPQLVRLDRKDGRFFLTASHPSGAGVMMFGPETPATTANPPSGPADGEGVER